MSVETPKIVVDDIRKAFAALPVVGGIGLSVNEGEFLAIVGPSGCGKSTLMNMLAGFEQPDAGGVRINGQLVTKPSPKGIAKPGPKTSSAATNRAVAAQPEP